MPVCPGHPPMHFRPSRPRPKMDGLDAWVHWFRDLRKSRSGALRALGAKSHTRRNTKIGDGNKRVKSKLVTIMDPHGDWARATFKDKTTAFPKAQKKETQVAKNVARFQTKLEARGRDAEMVSQHKEEKERKLQEKTMGEKEAREMPEEMVRMHRERNGRKQWEMQMRKQELEATKGGGCNHSFALAV
ncbi:hypothetical protein HOY80DRAFT_1102337 [Tuber brumale]|nr:hypothetical protein HOY80DRAFT_1102337 [Tuber brumale]